MSEMSEGAAVGVTFIIINYLISRLSLCGRQSIKSRKILNIISMPRLNILLVGHVINAENIVTSITHQNPLFISEEHLTTY